MKYIIKQHFPSLKMSVGTILIRYNPIVGFSYYSDIYETQQLKLEDVETEPKFFEEYNLDLPKGVVYGDTVIDGIQFTLKDGTNQYLEINPIVLKSAEENNGKSN